MLVRVIVPPEPIVTPADVAGSHAGDDAGIAALIAAVTEEIDGPTGWLGRSLGPQTLELVGCSFYALSDAYGIPLPYGPVIDLTSVICLDDLGVENEVADTVYRESYGHLVTKADQNWPAFGSFDDAVRVRYRAGYDGVAVAEGGTGAVPERARQAIIMSVQHLKSIGTENLFLRSEEVEGIGNVQYTVTEQASSIIKTTSERLLSTLRVFM